MRIVRSMKALVASNARRATFISIMAIVGTASVAMLLFRNVHSAEEPRATPHAIHGDAYMSQSVSDRSRTLSPKSRETVVVGMGKGQASALKTAPVQCGRWPERIRVTGRLELNASRVAHVSSLVDGVVREVRVELGQTVKQGAIVATIDSREVGEAKLQLVKEKLQLASAGRTNEWQNAIRENTVALLEALQSGAALDEIETAFRDRPVGAHREQLVTAMSSLNRAQADFERVRKLGAGAIIPEKEVIRARAEHEAAAATYQALREQIRFDVQQRTLEAQQNVQAAEAAVAVSRAHLLILGYRGDEIDSMDPIAEGERVAYYPVRSPIGGTVIARNVPLSQHVNEQTELVRIADLSTVWLRGDVFEKDLEAVRGLQERLVTFTTGGYPGRSFSATIFSLGGLVAETTRAAPLLAVADNADGLLKPGMFVDIEMTARHDADIVQLPASAIQRHAGSTFVFVAVDCGGFERRDVQLGRSTSELVEVRTGLSGGETVVVRGGFALKSEMLSDLLVEE